MPAASLRNHHENGDFNSISIQAEQSEALSPMGGDDSEEALLRTEFVYPKARFSIFFMVFIVVESLVAIILWAAGGDSKYVLNSIGRFEFTSSVFDLALLSLIKCAMYLPLVYKLDENVKKSLDIYNSLLQSRKRRIYISLVTLSVVIVIFCIAKGSLILHAILNAKDYPGMSEPFFACLIWCIITSVVNLVLCVLSLNLMARVKFSRTQRYFNQFNVEVDKDGQEIPPKADTKRLIGLAKPEAGLFVMACICLVVSGGVQSVVPLIFGQVLDGATESMAKLNRSVILLFCLYVVGAVGGMIKSWLLNLAGQRLVARMRSKLFASIILQETAFFDSTRTGELCNRLASDTQVIQTNITTNVAVLFKNTITILMSLALMFYLEPSLTGVLFAVVPIVSLLAVKYGTFVRKTRKKFQDHLAEAGTKAEEALSSLRTVRFFSGEAKEIEQYSNLITCSYKLGKKMALAEGLRDGVVNLCAFGSICATLWYGGKLVHDNTQDPNTGITAGLLTSFLLYTLGVAVAFAAVSAVYGQFMQAAGASIRIFTLMDRKPRTYVSENPLTPSSLTGEISFSNIVFSYQSRPDSKILKGISFTVKPGEVVALVGPSGGGKSTIVSLIERLYDPDQGKIYIDGNDIGSLDVNWLRTRISLVSQEPTLFACSIKDNISYGKESTDEEIQDAAKQANAHDFITEFDDGYDTLVGERGIKLSGGQKQRIAIARSLIMNPSVLLLDEATSALDAESEHLVKEAVDRAMSGRTVIIIAHRLSTVKNANKVIVVNKGNIAEMGTHAELLALGGVYKSLVLRQLNAGLETPNESFGDNDNNDDLPDEWREDEDMASIYGSTSSLGQFMGLS